MRRQVTIYRGDLEFTPSLRIKVGALLSLSRVVESR